MGRTGSNTFFPSKRIRNLFAKLFTILSQFVQTSSKKSSNDFGTFSSPNHPTNQRQFDCLKMKENQMNNQPKLTSIRFTLAVVAGLIASAVSSNAQSATATISGTPVSGGFDYTILLHNTGSDNLNDFWYGWTSAGNNLPSNPSLAGNSLGWANVLDSNSIQWENNTGAPLSPGQTGTFTFFSTSTPAAITTSPSGGSVAYTGTGIPPIDFSQGQAGDSTGIITPILVPAPEPSSLALLTIGSLGLLASGWRKLRAQ